MPILFIHGRGQEGLNKEQLHTKWRESLFVSGAERAGVRLSDGLKTFFPYYGNILTSQKLDRSAVANKYRSGQVQLHEKMQAELIEEVIEVTRVRAKASGLTPPDLATLGHPRSGPDALRGTQSLQDATRSLSTLLGAVNGIIPQASTLAVNALTDVARYLTDATSKRAVHDIVVEDFQKSEAISKKNREPLVIVAHSLGSVVAIEFLAEHPNARVDLLITLGSPLGLTGICRRLIANPIYPKCVARWVNASDPFDVVAAVPALGRNGLFFKDYQSNAYARCDVLNLIDVANSTDNHHSITGYLDEPAVARLIHQVFN